MKKALVYIFALSLLLLVQQSWAQDVAEECHRCPPSHDIKTLAGSVRHFGFYGGLSLRTTELNNEALMMGGFRLGFIANRSLGIGIEGYGIIPTASYNNVIQGQSVIPLGGYGGLTLEPIIWSNKAIHLTFPVTGGAGWLGYHEDWKDELFNSGEVIAEDVFWYVEPGVNIEINISKVLRIDLGVSKRFLQEFELINTPADSFETLNYTFGLKIGRF